MILGLFLFVLKGVDVTILYYRFNVNFFAPSLTPSMSVMTWQKCPQSRREVARKPWLFLCHEIWDQRHQRDVEEPSGCEGKHVHEGILQVAAALEQEGE